MATRNVSGSQDTDAAAALIAEQKRQAALAKAAQEKAAAQAAKQQAKSGGPSQNVVATSRQAQSGFESSQSRGTPLTGTNLPKTPEELPLMFQELKGKSKEDLKKLYDAMGGLSSGSFPDKAKALGELSKQFPDSTSAMLERLGIKDAKLAKLASNPDALKSLGTLTSEKASVADKVAAALKLGTVASGVLKAEELEGTIGKLMKGLPGAQKFAAAVATWSDPNKSAIEKAKAALEVATASKDVAGKLAPELRNDLRKADGSLRAIEAGITLFDPEASPADKALAVAQLAAELPDLERDLTALKQTLQQYGIKDANAAVEQGIKAADVPVKGLDPKLASTLSADEVAKLKGLADTVGAQELEAVLGKVTDKPALDALVGRLSTLDAAASKRLLTSVAGMENSVLAKTLADPSALESLGKLAVKLDDDGAKLVAKMTKELDPEALEVLFKLADATDGSTLKAGLKGLAPAIEKGGSKLVGQSLKVLDKMLGKFGVKLTEEVAGKVFKNLVKAIPVLGVAPNAIDAVKYGKEALELQSRNKDLGYFALTAANLNVMDAAVGTALDLTGVGAAVDVGAGVLFGAAELAMDLAFDSEKKKLLANPDGYQAPDWMKAVNLAGAAVMGPGGMAQLASYYGPEGAAELVQWGAEKGMHGGIELAKLAGVQTANAVGSDLKLTAAMIHSLADVIRNPTRYTEAIRNGAIRAFDAVIEKGGELAGEAKKILGGVIDDALAAGKKGFETIQFIAQHPGQSAKLAIDALGHLVSKGIDLASATGRELYKQGVETLQAIESGYQKLKGAAKQKAHELITAAREGLSAAIDTAARAGQKGMELLTWAATHPGEVAHQAKEALVSLMRQGGEVAKEAWEAIKSGGAKVSQLAHSVIQSLKNGGAKAVETLRYIAEHPGTALEQAGQWVGETLTSIARSGIDGAKEAAQAVKDFVDRRVAWAKHFATDMLRSGVAAFQDVAKAWRDNLTEGGREILTALRDLKGAGVDALQDLASAGGQLAHVATGYLGQMAHWGVDEAHQALGTLQELGGEVGDAAGHAYRSVKSATNGEFTVGGYRFDLNPLW